MKRIVTIGGGTGHYTLLTALRDIEDVFPMAVVSMADSGGSSGKLRDQYGSLPSGDVLQALLALSGLRGNSEKIVRDILTTRFTRDPFQGHNAGNFLLTWMFQYGGSFYSAVQTLGELLKVRGRVIPATVGNITLKAELENGEVIIGETNIDCPKHDASVRIKSVFLEPNALAFSKATEAIEGAEKIIIGPGDLYTSIIPVLLINGIKESLRATKAEKIYIANIMTKKGETDNFCASNFWSEVEKYAGVKMDKVIVNNATADPELLAKYEAENKMLVKDNLSDNEPLAIKADLLSSKGDLLRHDADKLKEVLKGFI